MGQKERDDTKAEATSAKVVPLWPASIRDDLPTGYLEQVARRVRANLTDLVATADTYDLDLATEFRIAAELLQQPSGTSHPLPIAESTGLTNGAGGCWELVDHNGTVLGLIMAVAFFRARARKMVRQYPWLYEPNGPLGWRTRQSDRAG